MRIPQIVLVLAVAALGAPAPASAEQASAAEVVEAIASAHGEADWDAHMGFTSRFSVDFGEKIQLAGRMTFDTAVGRARMELDDGTVIVNDGTTCWVSPADAPLPPGMARFHSLTWPYFLAMPFKLDDPGTHVKAVGEMPWFGGEAHEAWKLTFGEGVGDAPDDWYFLFRDEESRLIGTSYIVTYTKDKAAAEAEPHAVCFEDFADVDGAAIPTRWTFHDWSMETGLAEEQIGLVTISEPAFTDLGDDAFAKPAGEDVRVDDPM